MDKYALILSIPDTTPLNTASNLNWRRKDKQRKKWNQMIAIATYGQRPRDPLKHARVIITRHTTGPAPDGDNLVGSTKILIDALIRCGVLLNDDPLTIGMVDSRWRRGKRGKKHTTVYVSECAPLDLDLSAWEWELE